LTDEIAELGCGKWTSAFRPIFRGDRRDFLRLVLETASS
jgi:hypothetical protein